MKKDFNIEFVRMTENDVTIMTAIMKRAFDEDTRRHLGSEAGGPPGYDNGDFLRQWYLNSGADAYKIIKDGEIIGGVNIFHDNNVRFLGNIFLDTVYEDQGIGTYCWKKIEEMYPDTVKWCTETPGFSKRNHNYYVNKCGFHVVKIENPQDTEEESYILEKIMN